MMMVYIVFGVVIVLILAGFGIARYVQQSSLQRAEAFDVNTPTPGPNASAKPIHLKDGQSLGSVVLPTPDPKHMKLSDTAMGGQNKPVDGIPCESQEAVQLHVHSHLSLFVHGKQVQIPALIGMAPSPTGGCLYWIHTHDASGLIHVEAGSVSAPQGGPFTLGDFFDIWGMPLSRTQVATFQGPVTAYVNGALYTGNLADIPLRAHQVITLEVGTPLVPPPHYIIPPND